MARQWSSTRDIPWHTLAPLPNDIEHAMCQLATFFTEVECIAGDVPGGWLGQINNTYHETKLFLATQVMDEARHLEVFRKRALANGGGEKHMDVGMQKFGILRHKIVQEYLQRCHSIGLDRQERCKLREAQDINII